MTAVRVGAWSAVGLAVILVAVLANTDREALGRVLAVGQCLGFAACTVGLAVVAVSEWRAGWRAAEDRAMGNNGNNDNGGEK